MSVTTDPGQSGSAPAPIRVFWHEHAADVPAAAWEIAGAREAGLCLPLLRAMQDGGLASGLRYATAATSDRVVGILIAFLLVLEDAEVLGPEPLRVLVLSDPMGMCRPPLLVAGASAAERQLATDALLDALTERARNEEAEGVHAYWIGEGAAELGGALAERGFVAIPEEHCAYVPLLADPLGPYPAALRSSYRNVIKRKRKELAELGLELRRIATPSSCDDALPAILDRLYLKVAARKEEEQRQLVEARFTPEFFALAIAQPDFRVYLCGRPGEEPLGFLLGVQSGDTFLSVAVGLDYARIWELGGSGLSAAIYTGLHVEALSHAQAAGARWATLGISALEGKARLGALCERNLGMGLGFTERARAALHDARAAVALGDELPPCRPYPETALAMINEEAARRGIRLAPGRGDE